MAFADAIRTTTPDFSDTADLLEDLLASENDVVSVEGSTSTTSVSYVVMDSMTATVTVATGDLVFVSYCFAHSAAAPGDRVKVAIHEDGTTIGNDGALRIGPVGTAATDGLTRCISGSAIIESPNTGSVTYDLRWRVDAGSPTTVYANNRTFTVIVFRQS